MTDLFDEDEILDEDGFVNPEDDDVDMDAGESAVLDARRRLENMLEEKRLREELDDFMDY